MTLNSTRITANRISSLCKVNTFFICLVIVVDNHTGVVSNSQNGGDFWSIDLFHCLSRGSPGYMVSTYLVQGPETDGPSPVLNYAVRRSDSLVETSPADKSDEGQIVANNDVLKTQSFS